MALSEDPGGFFPQKQWAHICSSMEPGRPLAVVDGHGGGRRWIRQKELRASILASARQLVEGKGYDKVALRELAFRSDVTAPTIYSLVGRRREVLRSAILELSLSKITLASELGCTRAKTPILAWVDIQWSVTALYPCYSRQVVRAMAQPGNDDLYEALHKATQAAFLRWLLPIADGGSLRIPVSLPSVAEQLWCLVIAATQRWGNGQADLTEYRRDLMSGVGLMMLGLVDKAEARTIERWLGDNLTVDPRSLTR